MSRRAANSNAGMVDLLKRDLVVRKPEIEAAMRAVDRGLFTPRETALGEPAPGPYNENALKRGDVHISAPGIYATVLENLDIKPGMSFLNLGSGTGYLSSLVGVIIGKSGVNEGVERLTSVLTHAKESMARLHASKSIDPKKFSEPVFVQGNAFNVKLRSQDSKGDAKTVVDGRYDRIYVGAASSERYVKQWCELLKPGGVLVAPFEESLVRINKGFNGDLSRTRIIGAAFASLVPAEAEDKEPVWLPLQERKPVDASEALEVELSVDLSADHTKAYAPLFKSTKFSDLTLLVGPDRIEIPAHRVILASHSAYFAAHLFGKLAEALNKESTVSLVDLNPFVFETVLKFIYTGHLTVALHSLMDLLAIAGFLQVDGLRQHAVKLVGQALTVDTAVHFLISAREAHEVELYQTCLQYICEHGSSILSGSPVIQFSFSDMKAILSNDTLQLEEEMQAFVAVQRWVEARKAEQLQAKAQEEKEQKEGKIADSPSAAIQSPRSASSSSSVASPTSPSSAKAIFALDEPEPAPAPAAAMSSFLQSRERKDAAKAEAVADPDNALPLAEQTRQLVALIAFDQMSAPQLAQVVQPSGLVPSELLLAAFCAAAKAPAPPSAAAKLSRKAQAEKASSTSSAATVIVANISPLLNETHLKELFGCCGSVQSINLTQEAGQSVARVTYSNAAEAKAAAFLDQTPLGDRNLRVTLDMKDSDAGSARRSRATPLAPAVPRAVDFSALFAAPSASKPNSKSNASVSASASGGSAAAAAAPFVFRSSSEVADNSDAEEPDIEIEPDDDDTPLVASLTGGLSFNPFAGGSGNPFNFLAAAGFGAGTDAKTDAKASTSTSAAAVGAAAAGSAGPAAGFSFGSTLSGAPSAGAAGGSDAGSAAGGGAFSFGANPFASNSALGAQK